MEYNISGALTHSLGAYSELFIKFGFMKVVSTDVVLPRNFYKFLIRLSLLKKYGIGENYEEMIYY